MKTKCGHSNMGCGICGLCMPCHDSEKCEYVGNIFVLRQQVRDFIKASGTPQDRIAVATMLISECNGQIKQALRDMPNDHTVLHTPIKKWTLTHEGWAKTPVSFVEWCRSRNLWPGKYDTHDDAVAAACLLATPDERGNYPLIGVVPL